jgi:hypothetical protein
VGRVDLILPLIRSAKETADISDDDHSMDRIRPR